MARRPRGGARARPADPAAPLELQLLQDAQLLDRMADVGAPDADLLRERADQPMLRLLVLLEAQGRPLAARHFAALRTRRPTHETPTPPDPGSTQPQA